MKIVDEIVQESLDREPELGKTDESKCLPGWIVSLYNAFTAGGDYILSHDAVGNLCHTLIAAKVRSERLVTERDEYKDKAWKYDSLSE